MIKKETNDVSSHLTKEAIEMENKYINKNFQCHMSAWKWKLNNVIPLCTFQNGQNWEYLTISDTVEDMKHLECSFVADRNAKWHEHVGRKSENFLQIFLPNPAIVLLVIY